MSRSTKNKVPVEAIDSVLKSEVPLLNKNRVNRTCWTYINIELVGLGVDEVH